MFGFLFFKKKIMDLCLIGVYWVFGFESFFVYWVCNLFLLNALLSVFI